MRNMSKIGQDQLQGVLAEFQLEDRFSLAFAKVLQVVARNQRLIQRGEFVHIDKEVVMPGVRG